MLVCDTVILNKKYLGSKTELNQTELKIILIISCWNGQEWQMFNSVIYFSSTALPDDVTVGWGHLLLS